MKNFKSGTYTSSKTGQVCKYRSSYELVFCKLLDELNSVKTWSFEKFYITYYVHGKPHKYLVDFCIDLANGSRLLIEVKPKTFYEKAMLTKDKNWYKWVAANDVCKSKDWTFRVVTEQGLQQLSQHLEYLNNVNKANS